MSVLVTGAAGFIGMHTAERLLARGETVFGIDNLNAYYDPRLKLDRLARLTQSPTFTFIKADVANRQAIEVLFEEHPITHIVHLAAQAGVRYSITHPHAYGEANLVGFLNILEAARHAKVKHLVYASSSSVYGGNQRLPFRETDSVDHPVSLYAATKKANEVMAHAYSHLYNIPTTGLRFFTVYGPWGRPDMAYFSFAKAILENRPIQVFNHGHMKRDFTYITDIVDGVIASLDRPATPDISFDKNNPHPHTSEAPFRIFNIGNEDSVDLHQFITILEQALGKTAILENKPMQAGDIKITQADTAQLSQWIGMKPKIRLTDGIPCFAKWLREYMLTH